MIAPVPISADPLERRRLWREWIHTDRPQVERTQKAIVRRAVDASRESNDWLPEVIGAPEGIINGLKRAVDDCLIGDILPIADRERLLRRAVKLGLNRFEANLLIAAVQNRARERCEPNQSHARAPASWGLTRLVAIALTIEAIAVLLVARLLG